METLSADRILNVWERGLDLHPVDRCLVLLSFAVPERRWDELAQLPVGERDALLLELRERVFGDKLEAFVSCPACSAALEFGLSTQQLRAPAPDLSGGIFRDGGVEATLRPANSYDLASIVRFAEEQSDVKAWERALAARCIVGLQSMDANLSEPLDPEQWIEALPEPAFEALCEHYADLDPQASIELNLSCRSCEHRWTSLFDIGGYVWEEIARAARALLAEVDAIARVYGWTETEILRLSARRRAAYLRMAWGRGAA